MLANSPQTRLDITQTQQIARNGGLSLQTACKREVWGTASGGPYHWGGGWGGGYGTGDRDHIYTSQVVYVVSFFALPTAHLKCNAG